jgi:hypothetical protein
MGVPLRAIGVFHAVARIVCPHDHLRHAKVRAFIDWVRKERDEWAASASHAAELSRG